MEIQVSLSALPPSMYRKYRKGWKPNPTLLGLFEKISGKKGHKAMRIYIDAKTDNVVKTIAQNIKPPIQIVDALMEKDIVLVDYLAGTGKDSHGRIVKIGRVLSKMPELKKMFDSDPNRKSMVNATRNNQLICISMHPYDIAGMSTDRGWVSCMDLKKGSNKRFVKHDVDGGTLIAYLIDPKDKNINKPIARCLAKPFFERKKVKAADKFVGSDKVNALYLVEFAYPDSKMPFVHTLQDWLNEQINPFIATTERKGIYELSNKLYADTRGSEFDHDIEGPMLRNDVGAFITGVLAGPRTADVEDIVLGYVANHPQIAMVLADKKWGQPKFYARVAAEFIENKKYSELGNFFALVFDKFGVDGSMVVSRLWAYVSGKPRAMKLFIDKLPDAQRQSFLDANLGEADLYGSSRHDIDRLSYPAALSQIWSFAKYTRNPEATFWYNASHINSGGIQTQWAAEEYPERDRYRSAFLLAPAIGSLANMSPVCPAANFESLERHKDSIAPDYYRLAKKVFEGYKYVHIDSTEDFHRKLRSRFEMKANKFKKSEIATLIYRTEDDMCIGQAREELYPDVIDIYIGQTFLIDTDQPVMQIIDAIVERALDIAVEQAKEEVLDMREQAKERRARLAAKK